MPFPKLIDPDKHFIAICFIQEADLAASQGELEKLGQQRNVTLFVQPCPYEGIEFLSRYDDNQFFHQERQDERMLWKMIAIKGNTDKKLISTLANAYYNYLCAILSQDGPQVKASLLTLEQNRSLFLDAEGGAVSKKKRKDLE